MSKELKINLLIALGAAILFIPFIGRMHLFDWDEINFAEAAREMIASNDYLNVQIYFKPFWEKPPLFFWLQVISMKLFGINEFAARFPNAIAGIVTLLLLYNYGKRFLNKKFAVIWVLTYTSSFLPFFYFKSGIIDPWFNLFIFLGVANWHLAVSDIKVQKKYIYVALSAAFIGLAVITKGPVGLLIFGLVAAIMLVLNKFRLGVGFMHVLVYLLVLAITGGSWFILQILNGNFDVVVDFIVYQVRLFQTQDAGHGGFPMYHFVILFFGVFPASIFVIHSHKRIREASDRLNAFRKVMLILFWTVLILFSVVKTKIVHYSSLAYFPMSYLAAYAVYYLLEGKYQYKSWVSIVMALIAFVFASFTFVLPFFDKLKYGLIESGRINDQFTIGNLQADAGWSGFEWLIGFALLVGVFISIRKMRQRKYQTGFLVLSVTCIVYIYSTILFIPYKIEKYTQNAVVEFYKEHKGEDAYFMPLYKSYAMLFYTQAEKPEHNKAFDQTWLRTGDIDKPVYFVIRIHQKERTLEHAPEINVLYEKNGFAFCIRHPQKNKEELSQ